MSELPDWFDIEDREYVTHEIATHIFQQAEKCLDDQIDSYQRLKVRCEALFAIKVTLITAILGVVLSNNNGITLLAASLLAALPPLAVGAYTLLSMLRTKETPASAQQPRLLFTRQYVRQGRDVTDILCTEIMGKQKDIDAIDEIVTHVTKVLDRVVIMLTLAPINIFAAGLILFYFFQTG